MVNKKLEELAFGLYKARKDKNQADKESKDYLSEIKKELQKEGIKPDKEGKIIYDGSAVHIELSVSPSYSVKLDVALKYADIKMLYSMGILELGKKKFEDFLKSKDIKLEPQEYLRASGSHETLDVKLK